MTSNQVFGRGDEGASAAGTTTPSAAVAVELQPMLRNKSAPSSPSPCGACVADGVEPGVGVVGSEHGGGGGPGGDPTKATQNNNKRAHSQQGSVETVRSDLRDFK